MEKQKVYVVQRHYWTYNFGETVWSDTVLDSIWSRKEDAMRRVDDLANEYVRSQWYNQECDIEGFECYAQWAEDRMSVKMSVDSYEEDSYYIEELEVNPLLPEFEGP